MHSGLQSICLLLWKAITKIPSNILGLKFADMLNPLHYWLGVNKYFDDDHDHDGDNYCRGTCEMDS